MMGRQIASKMKRIVTRMDTPKYGETLKLMYIKYQPILVFLPSLMMVQPEQFMKANHSGPALRPNH